MALHRFQEIYNQTWIVERHGYQNHMAPDKLVPVHCWIPTYLTI